MTRQGHSKHPEEDDPQLREALAVLVSSTRSKRRPLPLTEIAKWLEIAVSRLGGYSRVADRIGISSKMLRQFSYVHRLSRPVQELFRRRELDSVDALAHLAMLPAVDQGPVAQALASKQISTSDVRAIVELRKSNRKCSASELIERVGSSKTQRQYVVEFVIRGTRDRKTLDSAITRHIPRTEIIGLDVTGFVGRLVLTKQGMEALARTARTLGSPLKSVVAAILEEAQ